MGSLQLLTTVVTGIQMLLPTPSDTVLLLKLAVSETREV